LAAFGEALDWIRNIMRQKEKQKSFFFTKSHLRIVESFSQVGEKRKK
jgi:hypothetical protein